MGINNLTKVLFCDKIVSRTKRKRDYGEKYLYIYIR